MLKAYSPTRAGQEPKGRGPFCWKRNVQFLLKPLLGMEILLPLSKGHVPSKLCGQLKVNGVEMFFTHKEAGAKVGKRGDTEHITQPTKCSHCP